MRHCLGRWYWGLVGWCRGGLVGGRWSGRRGLVLGGMGGRGYCLCGLEQAAVGRLLPCGHLLAHRRLPSSRLSTLFLDLGLQGRDPRAHGLALLQQDLEDVLVVGEDRRVSPLGLMEPFHDANKLVVALYSYLRDLLRQALDYLPYSGLESLILPADLFSLRVDMGGQLVVRGLGPIEAHVEFVVEEVDLLLHRPHLAVALLSVAFDQQGKVVLDVLEQLYRG